MHNDLIIHIVINKKIPTICYRGTTKNVRDLEHQILKYICKYYHWWH